LTFSLIIGIGIAAFILVFWVFQFDKKEHFLLQLFTSMFVILLFVLLGKAAIDQDQVCDVVVNQTVDDGSKVSYTYDRVCFENENNTGNTFYKTLVWFQRVFFTYIIFYFIYAFWLKNKLMNWNFIKRLKK